MGHGRAAAAGVDEKEDTIRYTCMESPHGDVLIARGEAGLTHISFQAGESPIVPGENWRRDDSALLDATSQLRVYFYERFDKFDLPLAPEGTDFQHKVWRALQKIPCGETVTYAQIAQCIGQPTATRAVASANARNPLPIVIPCHRVIGSDGKLRGYAGGLAIKAALLEHEWNLAQTH